MALWPWQNKEKDDPITKIDDQAGSMICLECGQTPRELLNIDGLYYCTECHEANERRQRFKDEEEEWNKPPQEG